MVWVCGFETNRKWQRKVEDVDMPIIRLNFVEIFQRVLFFLLSHFHELRDKLNILGGSFFLNKQFRGYFVLVTMTQPLKCFDPWLF